MFRTTIHSLLYHLLLLNKDIFSIFPPLFFSLSLPGDCKLTVSSLVFCTLFFLALFQISRVPFFIFFPPPPPCCSLSFTSLLLLALPWGFLLSTAPG